MQGHVETRTHPQGLYQMAKNTSDPVMTPRKPQKLGGSSAWEMTYLGFCRMEGKSCRASTPRGPQICLPKSFSTFIIPGQEEPPLLLSVCPSTYLTLEACGTSSAFSCVGIVTGHEASVNLRVPRDLHANRWPLNPWNTCPPSCRGSALGRWHPGTSLASCFI